MVQYGVAIGVGLLALVTAVAVLLASKVTKSIAAFREEHHESFLGRKDR